MADDESGLVALALTNDLESTHKNNKINPLNEHYRKQKEALLYDII